MTKEEKDCLAHLIVVTQFKFAKELAKALNGGQENNKMEKIILEKTIEQLKEDLNKEWLIFLTNWLIWFNLTGI